MKTENITGLPSDKKKKSISLLHLNTYFGLVEITLLLSNNLWPSCNSCCEFFIILSSVLKKVKFNMLTKKIF